MKKGEKVGSITKDNYKQVVARAAALREKLREHHQEYKGFPSLRYIIEKWGFRMSLKALCRHRTAVKDELGLAVVGKPTHVLPRPKKKKPGPTDPATARKPSEIEEVIEAEEETDTED